jgi:hypothetical protein
VITYCTNIHPGESWDETFLNLRTHLLAVKKALSPVEDFPIGLWLSNRAAFEIDEKASAEFCEWCLENGCFVPTINGFPYGSFHATAVKEKVYLPDWRSRERTEYTKRLADILDRWLPDGVSGSISTVPVGFRRHIGQDDYPLIRRNLLDVLEHMDLLKQKSGKEILLALEPEPGCVLETTGDAVHLFQQMAFPDRLKDGIGLCLDCCHQAIEFERPAESIKRLSDAGIRLGKVQLSSALRLQNVDRRVLAKFCEPTYLHQVVIRQPDGELSRYDDLPEALQRHRNIDGEEWRVHFHVPIFMNGTEEHETTRFFLQEILPLMDDHLLLEVETYTWDILPPEFKGKTVAESIVREIQWAESFRNETNRCS